MPAPSPSGYRPKKNIAWCRYCQGETLFAWDQRLGTARCLGCGVSTNDFHIKKDNSFFSEFDKKRFERACRSRKWEKQEADETRLF